MCLCGPGILVRSATPNVPESSSTLIRSTQRGGSEGEPLLQAQLVKQRERRGMHGVTPEVPEEVAAAFEHRRVDAAPASSPRSFQQARPDDATTGSCGSHHVMNYPPNWVRSALAVGASFSRANVWSSRLRPGSRRSTRPAHRWPRPGDTGSRWVPDWRP